MLVGLLLPTGGDAIIGGYNIRDNPVEAKRLIGYIPDFPYLYENLTGRDSCDSSAGSMISPD